MALKSLLEEAIEAWQYAREGVVAEVRNLPADAMTTGISGARTVAEIVHHIAESGLMMAGELSRADGDFQRQSYPDFLAEYAGGMARPTSQAELIALLEHTFEDGRDRLRKAGDAPFVEPIRQFNGAPARRLTWMHHGIGHEEYHRGQLALTARMLGHVPALTKLIHGE